MAIDYNYFKEKLEVEKKILEKELATVGRKNPDQAGDWEAKPADNTPAPADENEVADRIEDYEENVALVNTLEPRYQELKKALERIENGTYGICTVGGEEIERDRLEANPSASTCKKHLDTLG